MISVPVSVGHYFQTTWWKGKTVSLHTFFITQQLFLGDLNHAYIQFRVRVHLNDNLYSPDELAYRDVPYLSFGAVKQPSV